MGLDGATEPMLKSSTSVSTTAPKCESKARSPNHEMHSDFFKEDDDWDIYQPRIFTTKPILTESSTSGSTAAPKYESKAGSPNHEIHSDFFKEDDDWDIYQPRIITTKPIIIESSTSRSTPAPKYESKAGSPNHEMHSDFFKEDDDWDIYQPGIFTTKPIIIESYTSWSTPAPKCQSKAGSHWNFYQSGIVASEQLPADYTDYCELLGESPLEESNLGESSFKGQIFLNQYCLSKVNSNNLADYASGLTASPSILRGISSSLSNNSLNVHGTGLKGFEKKLLQDVKEYFLNNPVKVTSNLSSLERKICILTAPYFSREFARKYGLSISSQPIQDSDPQEESTILSRVMTAFELLIKFGISKEEFFRYICLGKHRKADTWSSKTQSVMDKGLNFIRRLVGSSILSMIYEQLRTRDQEFIALFYDQETYDALRSWNANENRSEVLTKRANVGDNLSHNKAGNTSDDRSEVGLSSTNSRSHGISTPGLNVSNSNSKSNDCVSKTSKYLKNLPKVPSMEPNYNSKFEPKISSPVSQSTSEGKKEILNSFDSNQEHLDKSKGSPDSSAFTLPRIPNSVHQNKEKKSNKKNSARSENSPKSGMQSSVQNIKENSRDDYSEKSREVLENVSNVKPRARKYTSPENDKKVRKKVRLQENSNDDKQESSDKEESPKNDKSRSSSQNNWPRKSGENCIVM